MKNLHKIILIVCSAVTVLLLAYAIMEGSKAPDDMVDRIAEEGLSAVPDGLKSAVSYNLYWGYFLLIFAIAGALFAAVLNKVQNPTGLVKSLISVVVIVVVIGGAYLVATSHGWADGKFLLDAGGEQLGYEVAGKKESFKAWQYLISDTSVLVTYVAIAGAALASVSSWASSLFKS